MKTSLKSNNKTGHQKLLPVRTKSLLVIDNTPIRKKSIKLAQGWLKKIEDTEKSAKKFQEIDLKLYTDWYNLTFNPLIESIDEVRREFLRVAEFHNLIVMISKEKNIPMPAAYLFLKDEEKEHIIRVYNNDGPGLPNEVAEIMFTPQANETVLNLLPEDSIVGRMLAPGGKNKIIKSEASGGAQHNIFTWILKGSEFESAKRFSLLSDYMEDTLTESLESEGFPIGIVSYVKQV